MEVSEGDAELLFANPKRLQPIMAEQTPLRAFEQHSLLCMCPDCSFLDCSQTTNGHASLQWIRQRVQRSYSAYCEAGMYGEPTLRIKDPRTGKTKSTCVSLHLPQSRKNATQNIRLGQILKIMVELGRVLKI